MTLYAIPVGVEGGSRDDNLGLLIAIQSNAIIYRSVRAEKVSLIHSSKF